MSIKLEWTIEGEKQLARRFRNIEKKVGDFKPEFKESTGFLKGFFSGDVFRTKGGAIGESWKKRRKVYPWPILQRTGTMRRSFREKASRMSGVVWNAADYFKFHQSRMPRRKLPRRIMMKLTSQLKDQIIQIFHKGLWKAINK